MRICKKNNIWVKRPGTGYFKAENLKELIRFLKIIGNKEKLFSEIKESKELMDLLAKSAIRELRPEEKDQFKSQFYDILKSVPSLAIFLLPGGAILLPLVIKIFPDLLPTSFKENIISKKEPPID